MVSPDPRQHVGADKASVLAARLRRRSRVGWSEVCVHRPLVHPSRGHAASPCAETRQKASVPLAPLARWESAETKLAIRRSAHGQGTPALGAAGSIGASPCLTSPADVRLPCWRQRLGVSEVTERGGGSEPGATRNGGKASLDTTTDQQPSVTGFAKLGRDASSGNRVLGLFPSFWGVGKVRRRASWKGVDQEEAPLSRQTAWGVPKFGKQASGSGTSHLPTKVEKLSC